MNSRARLAFGLFDVLAGALTLLGVFGGLPARYWAVDGVASVLSVLLVIAGLGLVSNRSWAPRMARAASVIALLVGLALVATLAMTASYLSGIYGPVGKGGALILVLVAALALPYLVILPATQLLWLGPARSNR